MIIFVVYKAGNCSEHIETQYERTVQFPENYNRRSKYIQRSVPTIQTIKFENNDDKIIKTENGMIKIDQTIFSVN